MSDSPALPALRRLDMNLLLTFDALMRTRSATAASRQLHKTQPAISRELARLRRRLDDPLLIVVKGRFVPTERALELHAAVHGALLSLDAALRPPAAFDPARATGMVNIGLGAHSEFLLAGPLMQRLHQQAPGLVPRFQAIHGAVQADDLDAGRLDLAVGLFGPMPARFHDESLLRERRVCVLSARHPLAAHKQLRLADLAGLRWFAFSQMYGHETQLERAMKPLAPGERIQFSAFLSDFGAAPYVIVDSDYATTMPASVARRHARHFALAILELPPPLRDIELRMVWPRRLHTSPLHAWLREQLRQVLAGQVSAPQPSPRRRMGNSISA
ncbi:LysR family transcriptional regulator [Bordetella hinzii]|uniref:LysR family transcriptional regulator n=1 Tax=Bordetella hinzii TaxID=103855 RepID=UPI0011546EC6|nr:LysR family transcriptional regulator [Bordetella hinzii]QDJ33135.1 LysR family transcriptional regulator [Bordetella hinzii]